MTRQEVAMRRRIENAQKMQDRAQEKIEREYMTDLEITRLCAEAMGCTGTVETVWDSSVPKPVAHTLYIFNEQSINYNPLHDDAQAMALVKKFSTMIESHDDGWAVWHRGEYSLCASGNELNRCICECVAKMKAAKK